MIINMKKNKKGFSMIEVIVVIFIFTVGIITIYGFIFFPLRYANRAKYRITAYYLAQEGIEIIGNIKDNNFAQNIGWLEDIPMDSCFAIDYLRNQRNCDNSRIYYSDNHGYSYEGSQQTIFFRRIETKVTSDADGEIFRVRSIVNWNEEEVIVYKDFREY